MMYMILRKGWFVLKVLVMILQSTLDQLHVDAVCDSCTSLKGFIHTVACSIVSVGP